MSRSHFETDWAFGDRVYMDGDRSIKATVTGFLFTALSHCARVEWIGDGQPREGHIQLYRLSKAE
jgi:hypothetical protein